MITVSPGQQWPIEARWIHNGVVIAGRVGATATLRRATAAGVERWNGAAWVSSLVSLSLPWDSTLLCYRTVIEVPAIWVGDLIELTCRLDGEPDISKEVRADQAVWTRLSTDQYMQSGAGIVGKVR